MAGSGRRPAADAPARKRSNGHAPAADLEQVHVRRFDADRKDTILSFAEALATDPGDHQLIWIDIEGVLATEQSSALAKRFGLDDRTRRALEQEGDRPHLAIHGDYFHVRVAAEPGQGKDGRMPWLDVVAGRSNIVVSQHPDPVAFLAGIDERVELDAELGAISAATFVALLLDGAVTTYFEAVDAVEDEVDELDSRSLRRDDRPELLDDLVVLRRQIARLRRTLAGHREVFAALADAGMLKVVDDADSAAALLAVGERFDDAIAAVEDAREVLIGSFDVYMTRTAQRTNDIMKILALTTVLLLPGSLIAGLLGMNVAIPLGKDDPSSFWLVVGSVVALAVVIVGFARVRHWL